MEKEIVDTSLQARPPSLFDLTAELRNIIYTYALAKKDGVYIYCKQGYRARFALGSSKQPHYWRSPPLLQTCRRIRKEASSIYYSVNHFTIVDEGLWQYHLRLWMSAVNVANIQNLTDVRVRSYEFEPTLCLINDIRRFWESLQGTDRAIGKEVLHMKLPIWERPPCDGVRGDLGVHHLEWLSMARIEGARVVLDTLLEHDVDSVENELRLIHWSETPTYTLPASVLTKFCI